MKTKYMFFLLLGVYLRWESIRKAIAVALSSHCCCCCCCCSSCCCWCCRCRSFCFLSFCCRRYAAKVHWRGKTMSNKLFFSFIYLFIFWTISNLLFFLVQRLWWTTDKRREFEALAKLLRHQQQQKQYATQGERSLSMYLKRCF